MSIQSYRYDAKKMIGEGGFGTVYVGKTTAEPSSPVAFKFAKKMYHGVYEDLSKEVFIMSRIKDQVPHTVNLRNYFNLGDTIGILIYDLARSSHDPNEIPRSVSKQLNEKTRFSAQQIISCTKQLLECLSALKKQKILHRDIKTANLIFNAQSNQLFVIDFGAGSHIDAHQNWNEVTTETYRAPEAFLCLKEKDFGIDMWGAGVVLFRLCTGKSPFGEYEGEVLPRIISTLGIPPDSFLKTSFRNKQDLEKIISEKYKTDWKADIREAVKEESQAELIIDLLEKIWRYQDRITVEEALKHPLFQTDYHIQLDCTPKSKAKKLFLSTLGFKIPLSARCIHLPMTVQRKYDLEIGTTEKCLHTFQATLKPGDRVSIICDKDQFKVEISGTKVEESKGDD